MKPKLSLIILSFNCLIIVSYAVNPACECVVFESNGRSQGTFTSPNYPQIYPSNINCILYTFIGELDEIVELTFLEFDVQVPITNKCTDFLRFFLDLERPEVNEHHQWNYEHCGNISMIPKQHYSSGRSLILEFHTDPFQGNNTGFRGRYRFIDKAQFEISGGNKRWGTDCLYDFYSNKKSRSGKFFSPRYPQAYPPGTNCQYLFYGDVSRKERVKITFQNIQLEYIDGTCSSSPDFVVVRDGLDISSPVIAQYCNTLNGEQVISSGENLHVNMMVDSKNQRQGFAATFEFIREDHQLPGPKPTPTKKPPKWNGNINNHNPGDSPFVDPDLEEIDFEPTTRRMPTECVEEYSSIVSKNGTFSSPFYPRAYPEDTTCIYRFQGKGGERVQIIFTSLDLSYPSGDPDNPYDCEDVDSVTVNIKINGEPHSIGVYCGSKRPPMLMSNNQQLVVRFDSRSAPSATGFLATYNFVTNFGVKAGEQADDMVCGFAFHGKDASNGSFTSPNSPGLYPRNTECHYLFYGQENERIYITFPYFDVEGIPPLCSEDTQSDYVEFSNFNIDLQDRKMHRYCGTKEAKAKKEVYSDGKFFRVTFKSNNVYDSMGFEAYYQFRKYEDPFSDPRVDHNSGGAVTCPPSRLHILLLLLITLPFHMLHTITGS